MKKIFLFITFAFIYSVSVCQNNTVNTEKLDQLLDVKQQMINNYDIKFFHTIQLFSGNKENALKAKRDYDDKGFNYYSMIEYETPNYKVWVGRFRTRFYADKILAELRTDYPNAFVLKPGR